jgi:heme oxygenase
MSQNKPAVPFSDALREAVEQWHGTALHSTFMSRLLAGESDIEAYADLTGQLWYVYRALEERTETLAGHPLIGPFVDQGLLRTTAAERDLEFLRGPDWREDLSPLKATEEYVARVQELTTTRPNGFLAHHYARHLGGLTGGQVLRQVAEKSWGFTHKGDGVRLYTFETITNPDAFKREYRQKLDRVGSVIDEAERRLVIEECARIFTLNAALFQALDDRHPPRG